MTATVLDLSPYQLPLPAPDGPVVLPRLAGTMHAHLNGRYADPVWSLAPLTDNPSVIQHAIHWQKWPAVFRAEMKLAAWNLINGELRPTFRRDHGQRMRGRLSMTETYTTVTHWKRLADWLEERGLDSLTRCDTSVLHDFGQRFANSTLSRNHSRKILSSITRLWALDQLSARPNGIGQPPWDRLGVDDYLPAATASGGENSTEPISEQTMGPLLIWAMRVVDDLSGDILASWAERQRLRKTATATPRPSPMDIPVTGQIAGRPWRPALDYNEAPAHMRHLGTAAFIVCAFLTGMRPGEVLGLRTGCCPDPVPGPGGQAGRHVIRGREFKIATGEDGNHQSGGVEREVPWVAITPVVNAIRVLERMVPDGSLLFERQAHDLFNTHRHAGSLKVNGLKTRIEDFVTWANQEAARHGLAGEAIPDDPLGSIGCARFRRSLAWHIARRPGGHVALAIQYGHMRTALGSPADGYAGRSRGGIHDLLDVETALALSGTAAATLEDYENGSGISGPAAGRALIAATAAARFEGVILTAAGARKLLRNPAAVIYDNEQACVLCVYKADKALCHRDGARDAPRLDQCVPGCGNIARTDRQAAQLRERAGMLDAQAGFVPQPVGDRMRATAARLREIADKHDRTRITHAGSGT